MPSMEETFKAACEAGDIPGAVLLARDKSGNLNYAKTFGKRSTKDPDPEENAPMALDTVMRIASCSKLITSIAAMQCVERGLLDLDADIKEWLPEVAEQKILTAFDAEGKPLLEKPKEAITPRRLLSHSSGLCYDPLSPLLVQWRALHGMEVQPGGKKLEDRFLYPLTYEPGSKWTYGPSVDWMGRIIERVNGGMKLEAYMEKNIWAPLGIKDMTFYLQERPDMIAKRADISVRDSDGSGKVVYADDQYWYEGNTDAFGGMGIFTTPEEYMKIMHSILANDGILLKAETVDLFFQPQLSDQARETLMNFYSDPVAVDMMGSLLPMGTKKDHGLGGMLLVESIPNANWRRKGTLSWSGLPNLFWFIDREAGLCAMYATQVRPAGDKKSLELAEVFERAMYERLQHTSKNPGAESGTEKVNATTV